MLNNKKEEKKSSGLPLAIIGLVLVVVVIGAWWFYSTSQTSSSTTSTNRNAANTQQRQQAPVNAPAGAPIGVNMLGSPTAVVTVEEFADFQCAACANVHPTMKEIQSHYGSRIRFIFRHFPLPNHDKSFEAALMLEAAGMQGSGKFWQMQDMLFKNQSAWSASPNYRQMFLQYAENIGLDTKQFQEDFAGGNARSRVEADRARGKGLGVTSTPSIYVNTQLVPFQEVTPDGLKRIIDGQLEQIAKGQQAAKETTQQGGAKPEANTESK